MQKKIIASTMIGHVAAWGITAILARRLQYTKWGQDAYKKLSEEIVAVMEAKKNG